MAEALLKLGVCPYMGLAPSLLPQHHSAGCGDHEEDDSPAAKKIRRAVCKLPKLCFALQSVLNDLNCLLLCPQQQQQQQQQQQLEEQQQHQQPELQQQEEEFCPCVEGEDEEGEDEEEGAEEGENVVEEPRRQTPPASRSLSKKTSVHAVSADGGSKFAVVKSFKQQVIPEEEPQAAEEIAAAPPEEVQQLTVRGPVRDDEAALILSAAQQAEQAQPREQICEPCEGTADVATPKRSMRQSQQARSPHTPIRSPGKTSPAIPKSPIAQQPQPRPSPVRSPGQSAAVTRKSPVQQSVSPKSPVRSPAKATPPKSPIKQSPVRQPQLQSTPAHSPAAQNADLFGQFGEAEASFEFARPSELDFPMPEGGFEQDFQEAEDGAADPRNFSDISWPLEGSAFDEQDTFDYEPFDLPEDPYQYSQQSSVEWPESQDWLATLERSPPPRPLVPKYVDRSGSSGGGSSKLDVDKFSDFIKDELERGGVRAICDLMDSANAREVIERFSESTQGQCSPQCSRSPH